MQESIKQWVNICIVKNKKILLLNRQHDNFKGWIQPGGKVEFMESIFDAAIREVKEETGLDILNLKLKGISGFINKTKGERYIYYDFLSNNFKGTIKNQSKEGNPKWWDIDQLNNIDMQEDIRKRIPLYLRDGSFEKIHYWDEINNKIGYTETKLFN